MSTGTTTAPLSNASTISRPVQSTGRSPSGPSQGVRGSNQRRPITASRTWLRRTAVISSRGKRLPGGIESLARNTCPGPNRADSSCSSSAATASPSPVR